MGCKSSSFPIEHNLKLDRREAEALVDASHIEGLLVGFSIFKLHVLTLHMPLICRVRLFVSDPSQSHMQGMTRVLRYLKGTSGQDILLP